MKSLGRWLLPCDSSDLSVKLDTQGQNQQTGALWDAPGGFRIHKPWGGPIHNFVHADTRGHISFIGKQGIREQASRSALLRLSVAICPMHNLYDWREGNGFILFSSRKVPEYDVEGRVGRFLGIRCLCCTKPGFYQESYIYEKLIEVLLIFPHDTLIWG